MNAVEHMTDKLIMILILLLFLQFTFIILQAQFNSQRKKRGLKST